MANNYVTLKCNKMLYLSSNFTLKFGHRHRLLMNRSTILFKFRFNFGICCGLDTDGELQLHAQVNFWLLGLVVGNEIYTAQGAVLGCQERHFRTAVSYSGSTTDTTSTWCPAAVIPIVRNTAQSTTCPALRTRS